MIGKDSGPTSLQQMSNAPLLMLRGIFDFRGGVQHEGEGVGGGIAIEGGDSGPPKSYGA